MTSFIWTFKSLEALKYIHLAKEDSIKHLSNFYVIPTVALTYRSTVSDDYESQKHIDHFSKKETRHPHWVYHKMEKQMQT